MQILGEPNYSTVAHSSVDQIDDATVMVSLGSLDGKNIKLYCSRRVLHDPEGKVQEFHSTV